MSTSIHHVAAIASDLKNTIRFYQDLLGLRVIHKHSLFEGPKVCHFYWNEDVEQFMTFYHCPGLEKAKPETKTIHSISLSVANSSFHFWVNRIQNAGLPYSQEQENFYCAPVLLIHDPDQLAIKLVFSIRDNRKGLKNSVVPDSFAIKGFYAVAVSATDTESIDHLLIENVGLVSKKLNSLTTRYSSGTLPGSFIDVCSSLTKSNGFTGCGGIHHIALQMQNWEGCAKAFSKIKKSKDGVISRVHPNQFSSLYFREGDGLLFELLGKMPASNQLERTYYVKA